MPKTIGFSQLRQFHNTRRFRALRYYSESKNIIHQQMQDSRKGGDDVAVREEGALSENRGPTKMMQKWSKEGFSWKDYPSFKELAADPDTNISINKTTDSILAQFFEITENGLELDKYANKKKLREYMDLFERENKYRQDRNYYIEFPYVKGKHVNHDFFKQLQRLHKIDADPDGLDPIEAIQKDRYQRFFTLGEQHANIAKGLQPHTPTMDQKLLDTDDIREGRQFMVKRFAEHLKETKKQLMLEEAEKKLELAEGQHWAGRLEAFERFKKDEAAAKQIGPGGELAEVEDPEDKPTKEQLRNRQRAQVLDIIDHNIVPQPGDKAIRQQHMELYSPRDQFRVQIEDSIIEQDMGLMEAKYKYYDRKVGKAIGFHNELAYVASFVMALVITGWTAYQFLYEELWVGRDYKAAWKQVGQPWYDEDDERLPQQFWPWEKNSEYQKNKRAMQMIANIREEERLKLMEELRLEEEKMVLEQGVGWDERDA